MDYQKLPLFIHDYPQDAVINPGHESLNYKLPKKLIYAFVTKENIDKFLARYSYRIVGSMETISFNPNVYEIDYSLVKRTIELTYDPFDLSKVYYNGKEYGLLDSVSNSKKRRKKNVDYSKIVNKEDEEILEYEGQ